MANGLNRIVDSLRSRIENDPNSLYRTMIELGNRPSSLSYPAASRLVRRKIKELLSSSTRTEQQILSQGDDDHPYVKARLQGTTIQQLVSDSDIGPLISYVLPDDDDNQYFNPDNLVRTVISVPMLAEIGSDPALVHDVQIEVNLNCEDGLLKAKEHLKELIHRAIESSEGQPQFHSGNDPQGVNDWKSDLSDQYVYASLSGNTIRALVKFDEEQHQAMKSDAPPEMKNRDWHTIYHVWPDFKLRAQIWHSTSTVKADASRRSFSTTGQGIVWAIFDSGIDGTHPHFQKHSNLQLPSGLMHMDFMQLKPQPLLPAQLTDDYGHGTHVAGIIAGELDDTAYRAISLSRQRDPDGKISFKGQIAAAPVIGVAPQCSLLSLQSARQGWRRYRQHRHLGDPVGPAIERIRPQSRNPRSKHEPGLRL